MTLYSFARLRGLLVLLVIALFHPQAKLLYERIAFVKPLIHDTLYAHI